jgi:hypothetical protein
LEHAVLSDHAEAPKGAKEESEEMKNLVALFVLLVAMSCMCAVPVLSDTLTFEDLGGACSAPDPYNPGYYSYHRSLQNGYDGFDWSNFEAMYATGYSYRNEFGESGFINGLVSGQVDIVNWYPETSAVMQNSSPFALHSAYLTGALKDGVVVTAQGYLHGELHYTTTVTVSAYHPTFVSYEFADVDRVVWTSSGGTDAGFGGFGSQFVMDDLIYEVVPEPSCILALLGSIGGMGGLAILRRKWHQVSVSF